MREVFDRQGSVVGWLSGADLLDRESRQWVGFVVDGVVHATDGAALGRYSDGLFRDKQGNVVAFTAEADAPLLPATRGAASPPFPPPRPQRPRKRSSPPPALAGAEGAAWGLGWVAFLSGRRA